MAEAEHPWSDLGPMPILLDGGMGTALFVRGLKIGECPDDWTRSHADEVLAVHRSYVEAGARVLQTNTFGGTRPMLKQHGLVDTFEDLQREAVALARQAANEADHLVLVAGNVGPTGLPAGTSPNEVEAAFAEQGRALEAAGVDYLSVETMSAIGEAGAAVRTLRRVTSLPLTACVTVEEKDGAILLPTGVDPRDAAEAIADAGAFAFGVNCSTGSGTLRKLAALLMEEATLPVIMKPNAGVPEVTENTLHFPITPTEFADDIAAMVEAGVSAVGGCCGAHAEYIRAVRDRIGG